ncbi:MAG: phage tail sheath family protein [Cetobacterium sp.]
MQFSHGVSSKEIPSSVKGMIAVQTPLVVVGTAPINMGDIESVNKCQLITNLEEAMKYFGGTSQLKYSIHEVLDLALNIHNVKPVLAINVLDPKVHKTNKTTEEIVVKDETVIIETQGILLDTLVLKNEETTIEKEEYIATFKDTGEVEVVFLDSAVKTVTAKFDFLDPSKVTKLDIIGGIEFGTSKRKGLECIDEIFPKYSMLPSCIIAPGFSHEEEVSTIIAAKAEKINGKFGCMGVVDLPSGLEYQAAIEEKKKLQLVSADLIACYGMGKIGEKTYHLSTIAASLMNRVDYTNDGIPYESPSNKDTKMKALVYKKDEEYIEILLDESQANLLNENGVVTMISKAHGMVLWGNRTACFTPGGNTDPKDMWIPLKRMFKYVATALILNSETDVDKPMTYSKAEYIKRNANLFLRGLVSAEKLLGASVDFSVEDNPLNDMLNGKYKWHISMGGVIPGETLIYLLEYDPSFQEAFVSKIGG